MILVDWSNCQPLKEELITSMSHHALDRAIERGGEPLIWFRQEVEDLINKAEDKIQQLSDKYKTFVIKGKRGLAVVGGLIKKGKDLIFKVFTVHRKKNFVPNNPNDAVITVTEMKENYTPEEIKKVLWNTFRDKARKITYLSNNEFEVIPEDDMTIDDANEMAGELEDSGLFDVVYDNHSFYITFLEESKVLKYITLLEKLTNKKVKLVEEETAPSIKIYNAILQELEAIKQRALNPSESYDIAIEVFKNNRTPILYAIFKAISTLYEKKDQSKFKK
jgi:hypothetical protein